MPKLNKIAELKTLFRFRAWAGHSDVMHFDEAGVCRYENQQGVMLKRDMLTKEYEILCDHETEHLRRTDYSFKFECEKCKQIVEVVAVKTVRPPHIDLPEKIELKPQGVVP